MFFVSLSNDARIFTSFSHEMPLWSAATWPTVFTRSREDYNRKESGLIQPPSPLPGTVCSQLPVWARSAVQRTKADLFTSFSQQSSGLEDCFLAVTMKLLLSLYLPSKWASSFCGGRRGWWREERTGGQLHNTWAKSSDNKSDPTRALCLQADTCVQCFKLLACSHSHILLFHFTSQIKPINILFKSFNAAIKYTNTLTNKLLHSHSEIETLQFYFPHILKRSWI